MGVAGEETRHGGFSLSGALSFAEQVVSKGKSLVYCRSQFTFIGREIAVARGQGQSVGLADGGAPN